MNTIYVEPNGTRFVRIDFDTSIYKSTIMGLSDVESLELNIKAQQWAVDYHQQMGNIGQVELFNKALQLGQQRLKLFKK